MLDLKLTIMQICTIELWLSSCKIVRCVQKYSPSIVPRSSPFRDRDQPIPAILHCTRGSSNLGEVAFPDVAMEAVESDNLDELMHHIIHS